jgi:hypothetical protein
MLWPWRAPRRAHHRRHDSPRQASLASGLATPRGRPDGSCRSTWREAPATRRRPIARVDELALAERRSKRGQPERDSEGAGTLTAKESATLEDPRRAPQPSQGSEHDARRTESSEGLCLLNAAGHATCPRHSSSCTIVRWSLPGWAKSKSTPKRGGSVRVPLIINCLKSFCRRESAHAGLVRRRREGAFVCRSREKVPWPPERSVRNPRSRRPPRRPRLRLPPLLAQLAASRPPATIRPARAPWLG